MNHVYVIYKWVEQSSALLQAWFCLIEEEQSLMPMHFLFVRIMIKLDILKWNMGEQIYSILLYMFNFNFTNNLIQLAEDWFAMNYN